MALPQTAPCSWSGETLRLRYPISKIWTQKASRSFGIYWSDNIGFGRLWPEPTPEELHGFYDIPDYDAYMSGVEKAVRPPNILSRIIMRSAWLADKSSNDCIATILSLQGSAKTVCDIGCGNGAFLEAMRSAGAKPTGIDPSRVSATAIATKSIEFFDGTAEYVPKELADRRFDVVSMFQSLEHCRDPLKAVSNAASLLSSTGLLVIDVPNMGCRGFDKYGAAWWHTDAGRHLQFFQKHSLEMLLARAGMRAVQWEYQGFTNQFTSGWIDDMRVAWDAIRPNTPRPSLTRSATYLPLAMLSPPERKYEIIRVYARTASPTPPR
jgi:2-polyprenyl-3-methyl-5-hydroxy-6-metoxy-1,4-benzoquinol methylase